MSWKEDYTMYCTMCGGPIEGGDIGSGWLSQVVLLHLDTEFPSGRLLELPARSRGGPYFSLKNSKDIITACDVSLSVVPTPKPLYLPCHANCLLIAKKVTATHQLNTRNDGVSGIERIWMFLRRNFDKRSEDSLGPVCNIYTAQDYNNLPLFQELVWQPGSDEQGNNSDLLEADPVEVLDPTFSTVSQLQELPREHHCLSPTESSSLPEWESLSLECEFRMPPRLWREALTNGYLPWLWDLDEKVIESKEAERSERREWNWELLVRQLAQINLHEPEAIIKDLPMGMRNRRRIWRVVEDILSEGSTEGRAG